MDLSPEEQRRTPISSRSIDALSMLLETRLRCLWHCIRHAKRKINGRSVHDPSSTRRSAGLRKLA